MTFGYRDRRQGPARGINLYCKGFRADCQSLNVQQLSGQEPSSSAPNPTDGLPDGLAQLAPLPKFAFGFGG